MSISQIGGMGGGMGGGVAGVSGVAMLPFTGGNIWLIGVCIAMIAVGVAVLASFVVTRAYSKLV